TTHYDAFGEPTSQTNGVGQTSTYSYDALGRRTKADSPDGPATFVWDTAPNGVGKLANATSPDKMFMRYEYDQFGHLSSSLWKIEGESFEVNTAYDGFGRPATMSYPLVFFPGGHQRLQVNYVYNANGYLSQVKDAAGGPVYWTADSRDAAGALTQEVQGNGVVTDYAYRPDTGLLSTITTTGPRDVGTLGEVAYDYDANRNVVLRNDKVNKRFEQFSYDVLNRLTRW